MDYKKKYEEALERARSMYESRDDAELAAFIFPELAESEDERVINALVAFINQPEIADKITFEARIEWLAWLNKQKAKERLDRMAPIYNNKESFESALEKAWKYYNESASRKVDSFEDDYIECVFSKGFREGFLCGKQKEQKHPDGCFTCDEYKKGYEAGRLNGFTAGYNKAMKEQKPVESISQLTVQGKGFYKICPRCKEHMVRDDSKVYTSMPPQYGYECPRCGEIEFDTVMYDNPEMKEQKPTAKVNGEPVPTENYSVGIPLTEWSEEDRKMLDDCIMALSNWRDAVANYGHEVAPCQELIDWLKSLRPSWKPSEEQMDRLFSIVAALRKDYCDDMADFLANLYADLKKLGVKEAKEESEYYQQPFNPDC